MYIKFFENLKTISVPLFHFTVAVYYTGWWNGKTFGCIKTRYKTVWVENNLKENLLDTLTGKYRLWFITAKRNSGVETRTSCAQNTNNNRHFYQIFYILTTDQVVLKTFRVHRSSLSLNLIFFRHDLNRLSVQFYIIIFK